MLERPAMPPPSSVPMVLVKNRLPTGKILLLQEPKAKTGSGH